MQTAMNAQAYRALTPREVATATQRGARALFPNYQILGLDATRTPSYVVGQNGERTIATTQVLIVLGRHARASFVAQEVMGPVAPVQVGAQNETGWQIIFPPVLAPASAGWRSPHCPLLCTPKSPYGWRPTAERRTSAPPGPSLPVRWSSQASTGRPSRHSSQRLKAARRSSRPSLTSCSRPRLAGSRSGRALRRMRVPSS
ncbi:MAG: hypothetical protein M0Z66_11165 [Thermaerobacter sp.]|nr:hypothetical protein [Thermaerobacter sp.]